MKRAIVTVLGDDRVGIIASVSSLLSEKGVNILDITQTVMKDDVFVMMALVDMDTASEPFHSVKTALDELGKKTGLSIRMQLEEIFNAMHKI